MNEQDNQHIGQRTVIVSAIAQFIIFGIRLSFSAFFAEFVLVEQWSSEAGASIFSISMIMFALGSVPSGMLLDRFGPRLVFSSGALLLALGLLLSGFTSTIEQLAFTYGIIAGAGLSVIGLGPTAANIAIWFPASLRGRAIGIAFAGTGLGSLVFVPLVTFLIAQFSWRSTYIILGCITLLVVLPLFAFGLRRHPSQIRQSKRKTSYQDAKPQKHYATSALFWVLIVLAFTTMGPVRSLTVHQIAYMEIVGIPREFAANIVGLAGFLTIWAFMFWGYISDRFGRLWAFGPGAVCLIAAVLVLFLVRESQAVWLLGLYSVLFALGEGSRSSQVTSLASDMYYDRNLGTINGWVGSMFGLGAAFGPWVIGRLQDMTESYNSGFIIIIVMTLISVIAYAWCLYSSNRQRNYALYKIGRV